MADNFKIETKGLEGAIKRLKALGGNIQKEVAPALFTSMSVDVEGVAKESFTPVSPGGGTLRDSIHTTLPKIRRGSVSVSVVAGGPAEDYALRVHEWLDPSVKWSVPGTGPKFLERPFLEATPKIKHALLKALGKAINKRK